MAQPERCKIVSLLGLPNKSCKQPLTLAARASWGSPLNCFHRPTGSSRKGWGPLHGSVRRHRTFTILHFSGYATGPSSTWDLLQLKPVQASVYLPTCRHLSQALFSPRCLCPLNNMVFSLQVIPAMTRNTEPFNVLENNQRRDIIYKGWICIYPFDIQLALCSSPLPTIL